MPKTYKAFYDPTKTYDDNFDNGPFPVFDDEIIDPEKDEPKYSFLGQPLYLPFGIAAGPLLNSRHIKYAFERGFDAPVYKTQRSIAFKVNDFPNVLYVETDGDLTLDKAAKPLLGKTDTSDSPQDFSITNSFGNPSRGPEFWVKDMEKALASQGPGQLMIASTVGSIKEGFSGDDYYDDFAEAARLAASAGVKAVEVNLSCPNVANEGVICYTRPAVAAICRKVKEKIGDTPLIIKLGYFSTEQNELLEQILKDTADYVAAVAAINTIPAPIVDEKGKQALPGPNRLKSGVCGAGVKWAGLDMTSRLNKTRKKLGLNYEIIGIGGVMTPKDFHAYRDAGADLVQSCTGAMWNPRLAKEIKESL
jgi:dihydroorotate dehydrogenase (NAD+) catalytic subunit